MASNLSLTITKNPATGQIIYGVVNNATGQQIYETPVYSVARSFAQSGRTDAEIIALANQQTINLQGGVQTAPATATPTDASTSVPTLTASDDAIEIAFTPKEDTATSSSYNAATTSEEGTNLRIQSVEGQTIIAETTPLPDEPFVQNYNAATIGTSYATAEDPQTGSWYVYNTADPNDVIAMDLSGYDANRLAQQYNTNPPGTGTSYQNTVAPTVDQANLGPNARYAQEQANHASGATSLLQQQQTIAEQRNQGDGSKLGDWRVRLRLAPSANYLYKDVDPGILSPLRATDGVIFPYMPTIATNYSADYSPYDLTHSNYRGYFYKGSRVGEVTLTADFTAQDSAEADYLLAVITFFKACTKMFYGQDKYRGSPPPLVFLSGLGQYQFSNHACAISNFAMTLPNDVDYIRARGKQTTTGGQMMWRRSLSYTQSGFDLSAVWARLTGAAQSVGVGFGSNNANVLMNGAMNIPPSPPNLGLNESTYVPTKMSITLTLMPMMSRQQVSQQFSLQKFANGNLIKGGYW